MLSDDQWDEILPALKRYARWIFPPWVDDWQDAVQEAGLALAAAADVRTPLAYCRSVIYRYWVHCIRASHRWAAVLCDPAAPLRDPAVPSIESALIAQQRFELAMARLSDGQKVVLRDERLMDRPYTRAKTKEERNRTFRARTAMRRALERVDHVRFR
jgi:hypothetical protein